MADLKQGVKMAQRLCDIGSQKLNENASAEYTVKLN